MNNVTKTISQAIPTVDENGTVKSWHVKILFSCGDNTREFVNEIDVQSLAKVPGEFSKQELLGLANADHLEKAFNSVCECKANIEFENVLKDFDIDTLT